MNYRLKCTLACLGIGTSLGQAQVIRTETQVVLVDVIATDKKGAFVRDLDASELRVWEDGKEQKITSITRETKNAADNSTSVTGSTPRRYTVLLFDNPSLTTPELVIAGQAAQKFVDHTVAVSSATSADKEGGPLTAVVSYDNGNALRVVQGFTENTTRVKQAITIALATSSASASTDFVLNPAAVDSAKLDTIRALGSLLQRLESVPGRKTLVWFTPELHVNKDNASILERVIDAANRSNIAIYPVRMRSAATQPTNIFSDQRSISTRLGGIASNNGPMRSVGNTAQADAEAATGLLLLASTTGGYVVLQPNDEASMATVDEEQNEYYLLGYTPPSSAPDSCHRLRVEVKRKNVELRSRSDYCKRTASGLVTGNPTEKAMEARLAQTPATVSSRKTPVSTNIPASVMAVPFYTTPNVARVMVAVEMNPANLVFTREKGKHQSSINVLGLAQRSDGSTAARFSDVVRLEFSNQAEVDAFKQKPYQYDAEFEIASGDYTLTVALGSGVTDAGGSFGQLAVPLRILPLQNTDFTLSGLALSRESREPNLTAAALDDLGVGTHKRLIANGAELVLAGSNRFPRSGQAIVFFEVGDPLLASVATRASTQLLLQMRVLDRSTGAQKTDTGIARLDLAATGVTIQNGTGVVPVALPIPVQSLTAGNYVLEIQVADSEGLEAHQTVNFDVE
ncbi:MAG: VWA domain-containing protein [Acidobacteriota bacterium]